MTALFATSMTVLIVCTAMGGYGGFFIGCAIVAGILILLGD